MNENEAAAIGLGLSPDYQSAGTKAVAELERADEESAKAVREKEADAIWAEVPYDAPYNYREAYAAGDTDLKTTPLPNKHFNKGAVNVAGYDLSTGEKYQQHLRIDEDGVIEIGAKRLSASQTRPGQDPPVEDVGALAHIAYGYVRDGKNYEAFDKAVPTQWSEKQRKQSWKAATDTTNQRRLEKHIDNNMMHGEVKPASRAYEETIADAGFSSSGRQIYKSFRGKEFQGSDIEASKWLASHLRDLDFNTVMQAAIVTRIKGADDKTLKAYGQALDLWDGTEMERSVVAQLGNAGRMVLDPMNLAGAGIGKLTVVMAGRVAVKELLKRMAVGAVGGAVAGAMGEVARSQVAGKEVDTGKAAVAAGVGMAAGGILSGAVPEAIAAGGKMVSKGLDNLAKAKPAPMSGTPGAQLGAINPELKAVLAAEQPPYDPATGFYSPALRAVESIQQEKMTPAQAIAAIKSAPDVRQEELDWLGLEEAFKGKKSVTKQEVAEYVGENRTQLVERRIGGSDIVQEPFKWLEENVPEYRAARSAYLLEQGRIDALEQAGYSYDDPVLHGAVLRRGVALESMAEIETDRLDPASLDFGVGGARFKEYTVGRYGEEPESNYTEVLLINPRGPQQIGEEQHFGAQRGIVAWARTTDRERMDMTEAAPIGASTRATHGPRTGESVRFVEEVQSDTHFERSKAEKEWKLWQEKGDVPKDLSYDQYAWNAYLQYLGKRGESIGLPAKWEDAGPSVRRAMQTNQGFWSEAAFNVGPGMNATLPREAVKKWPIATLKATLFSAARDGKDWLAWSKADVHQERWGKNPLVAEDSLVVTRFGTRRPSGEDALTATVSVNNGRLRMPLALFLEKYKEVIPEDLAERLRNTDRIMMSTKNSQQRTIEFDTPIELEKGGYQMYDKEMVNEANKFLKRYGTKVEEIGVNEGKSAAAVKAWGVKLTPEIRKRILQGGVPLAAAGAAVITKESNGDQTD